MGLAGLLRAWRESAGHKRGLGRSLTQDDGAEGIERSVRWYRDLENGATPRLERATLDRLADVLQLGRDEQQTLHLYALGGGLPAIAAPKGDNPARRTLQLLLDQQLPSPTYLCDGTWNIIGYNSEMAEWYPWVLEPGANLMRWALLSTEARHQYLDWSHHAAEYLALLRFATFQHPQDGKLAELLAEILEDPDCRHIWESRTDVAENRDGHRFRMCLPKHGFEVVEVVSNVLYPAVLPDCRLVIITWLRSDTEAVAAADDDPRTVHTTRPTAGDQVPAQRRADARRLTTSTTEEAAAVAGEEAVPLPVLSKAAGEKCQLTLSPSTHTVSWATEEDDGRWSVSELDPYTVIVRLPHGSAVEAACEEYSISSERHCPPIRTRPWPASAC
ncbi:helix-turn-helix transcriptional regulator [Streptomyces sp. NPDC050848]|uniref:helix-turn-helix transcriptional regulator n=1 Tax=Streptomyces sp. NPDC050848 TaxID=3155791 RepID=UPI00340022E3